MKKAPEGEKDQRMLFIYEWKQHKETYHILFLKEREQRVVRKYNRGGILAQNVL
jgi:hypothetical protein